MDSRLLPQVDKFKSLIEPTEAILSALSPRHDIMLLRVTVALIAVVCFAFDHFFDTPRVYWMCLATYLLCLGLYALGLSKSVLVMRKVSAELLVVLVMIVTLLDGKPLSGALVAWFIGFGLYVSFLIIRKNREKIERLIKEGKKTAQVLYGTEVREIPIREIEKDALVIVPKGESHVIHA